MVVAKEAEKNYEREKSEVTIEEVVRGYTLDQFICKNPPFIRNKKQILNEPNPELPDYIKPPCPILTKKPKKYKELC